MRRPQARIRFFSLALLLILLASSLPALAAKKSALNPASGDSNLYRYANNNPVNFVDPEGLETGNPSTGLFKDAFFQTFSVDNAKKFGVSLLEALSLIDPKGHVIEAAADSVGGESASEFLKIGTSKGRRRAARSALRKNLSAQQIRDFPSGYTIPSDSVLKTRKVWKQGSEIAGNVREGLAEQYPNANPMKWKKVFGDLEVADEFGNLETLDIHWYEHPDVDVLHAIKCKPDY